MDEPDTSLWVSKSPELTGVPTFEDVTRWHYGQRITIQRPKPLASFSGPLALSAMFAVFIVIALAHVITGHSVQNVAVILIEFAAILAVGTGVFLLTRGHVREIDSDWAERRVTVRGRDSTEFSFARIQKLSVVPVKAAERVWACLQLELSDEKILVIETLPSDDLDANPCLQLATVTRRLAESLGVAYEIDEAVSATGLRDSELAALYVTQGDDAAIDIWCDGSAEAGTAALAYYSEANRLDPCCVDAMLGVGKLCELREDYAKAIDVYSMAIETQPECAELYSRRASAHLNADHLELAVADSDEVIRLNPTAAAHTERAAAYKLLGHYERALADYDAALHLAPDDASLHDYRADCLVALEFETEN